MNRPPTRAESDAAYDRTISRLIERHCPKMCTRKVPDNDNDPQAAA